ncbi:hypothetical protein BJX99DRAFT_236872, partial [Aspergillus californicus]
MGHSSFNMSDLQTPKKRAACDRCRTQKLRCLRVTGHPTDACIRCVRSQMECITSSSKRPGRPRNSTNAARQQTNPTPVSCNETGSSLPAVDIPIQLDSVDDWFNFGSLDTDYDICSGPWGAVETGLPMDGIATAHSMSSLSMSPPLPGPTTPAFLNTTTTDTSVNEHFLHDVCDQEDTDMMQLLGPQPFIGSFDHGLHLTLLQRELSKQLFTLNSVPWDMTKVLRLTCTHDPSMTPNTSTSTLNTPSPPNQADLKSNPLAQITKTSADFASILCSVQSPSTSDTSTTTSKNSSPLSSIHPRLSMADLLTILSCHMLTISIYDAIFSHFTDQASHNPASVNLVLQSAPKLFLGGIAVPARLDLLSHLLYCLAGSQLRPIEMLLGLPNEYCVALKRNPASKDNQTGLFSGNSGQLLFSTLMRVETERASEEGGNLGVIDSLKERLRRIQGF